MSAPLSVNMHPSANSQVAVNESCNCCWPFNRQKKTKDVIKVTDEVFHKRTIHIKRYTPPLNKHRVEKHNGQSTGIKK